MNHDTLMALVDDVVCCEYPYRDIDQRRTRLSEALRAVCADAATAREQLRVMREALGAIRDFECESNEWDAVDRILPAMREIADAALKGESV